MSGWVQLHQSCPHTKKWWSSCAQIIVTQQFSRMRIQTSQEFILLPPDWSHCSAVVAELMKHWRKDKGGRRVRRSATLTLLIGDLSLLADDFEQICCIATLQKDPFNNFWLVLNKNLASINRLMKNFKHPGMFELWKKQAKLLKPLLFSCKYFVTTSAYWTNSRDTFHNSEAERIWIHLVGLFLAEEARKH